MLADDELMRAIVESSVSPYVVIDLDGNVTWASSRIEWMLGHPPETYVGKHFLEILHPDSHDAAIASYTEFVTPARPVEGWVGPPMLLDVVDADGTKITCEVSAATGEPYGINGAIIQIRRWRGTVLLYEAIDALASGEPLDSVLPQLAKLIDHDVPGSATVISVQRIGGGAALTAVAEPAEAMTTAFIEDLEVRSVLNPLGESELGELARAAGWAACWVLPVHVRSDAALQASVMVLRTFDGLAAPHLTTTIERVARLVGLAIESDDNRRTWEASATSDSLTGIPNRKGLHRRLAERFPTSGNGRYSVLFCDLDRFKAVNDEHGHLFGDQVLTVVAERLSSSVRRGDVAARWGGDEFVVVCSNPDRAPALADRLIEAVNAPMFVDGRFVDLGLSIGVAVETEGRGIDEVLAAADDQLRMAKVTGRNCVTIEAVA